VESIIAFLLPHFNIGALNIHEARAEIIDTLASYATRTRAEMLQAARIIAFSMATLDTLAEARTAEMSQSMRIRHRGCANGLNRSTTQTERALAQSQASEPPATSEPEPQPVRASLREHFLGTHPAAGSTPDRNKHLWAGALVDTLNQMGYAHHPAAG
jgi:hypothetical protein